MNDNLVVVTILCKDKQGLVAEITKKLSDAKINIVDIEQGVIHGLFSMFMLVDITNSTTTYAEIRENLINCGEEFDFGVRVIPFTEYRKNNIETGKTRLQTITILGTDKPGIVTGISRSLYDSGTNIEHIKMIARGVLFAMEMSIDLKGADIDALKEKLMKVGGKIGVDVILQPDDISRWRKRLIVFDMDSTIVDAEVIDEMARAAGVYKEVNDLTVRGIRGEIDFEDSLKKRVRMLKGLSTKDLKNIVDNLKLTSGSEELVSTLKSMGYKLALVSGGFTYFTDALKDRLGFDYTYANELVIKNNRLTGEVAGDIITPERKGEILKILADRECLSLDEVVAIGDGANDRIMLKCAGLGIAFNASEVLKKAADGSITKDHLRGLVYCLGISEKELKKRKCEVDK